jgi:hypothetical protein
MQPVRLAASKTKIMSFFIGELHFPEANHIGRVYGKNRSLYGKNLAAIFEL